MYKALNLVKTVKSGFFLDFYESEKEFESAFPSRRYHLQESLDPGSYLLHILLAVVGLDGEHGDAVCF